jgi:DNA-binding NarL/FixJ family response regulator
MAIKVFIVDDHYMVIEGIHSLLQNEKKIEWVGHASNAASCLSFLEHQETPDVILMDINLPDKSGIDLCREVKEKYPSTFILGLSTFNQQSFIEKMMSSGASGYLLKNATQEELLEGIQAVVNGKQFLSFDAVLALRKVETSENVPVITRREKEVLGLIADGMTNNEIAQKLFISVATVDTHRKNLLAKFESKNIASLIKMAMQLQLI